MFTWRQT